MIKATNKKSQLYEELEQDERKRIFSIKAEKFLHNIDSLYYVIQIDGNWSKDAEAIVFKDYLAQHKKEVTKDFSETLIFSEEKFFGDKAEKDFVCRGIGSFPYTYDFSKVDKYTVFIMEGQPNKNTPQLWVQLRSQFLWLTGEEAAVAESLRDIEKILDVFGLRIKDVKENRIDYAYHTNYIQDLANFFKEEDLNKMQQSRFSRASKEYNFVGEWDIEGDYLTLGRKKSNNVFFRTYNKTKEVVELGYKQFFLQIWKKNGMIGEFDFYCLEKAFLKQSWRYVDVARLEFYVEHGKCDDTKKQIEDLLTKDSIDYDVVSNLANKLVGKITIICNVEIETKRKFYYSFQEAMKKLEVKSNCQSYAKNLYKVLDNKQLLHDYITWRGEKGVIRFIDHKAKNRLGKGWTRKKEYPTAYWWELLQKCNLNSKIKKADIQLIRQYQKSVDINLLKKRTINQVATYSIYLNHDNFNKNFSDDILDFMSTINENDIENVSSYKDKKYAHLSPRLENTRVIPRQRNLVLVDKKTGESI